MNRFLILKSVNYPVVVISDDDEDFFMEEFIYMLAEPHPEKYRVRILDVKELGRREKYDVDALVSACKFISKGGLYRKCPVEEFDNMWDAAW